MKQDTVIKMFCLLLLHLVGLHDTTILGPDSFKGGLDVVVPLDNLMIIRYREILLYYNSQTFCSCILIKKKKRPDPSAAVFDEDCAEAELQGMERS